MTIGYNAARDLDRPPAQRWRFVQLRLNSEDGNKLGQAAIARDATLTRLVSKLVHIVLRDNLIDAVLDNEPIYSTKSSKREADKNRKSRSAARADGTGGSAGVAV